MKLLRYIVKDESGATAIEYGFIVALIVIGVVASISSIGQSFVVGPMTTVHNSMASR